MQTRQGHDRHPIRRPGDPHRGPDQALRRRRGPGRPRPRGPPRRDLRLPGTQRGRQDHHDPDHAGPHPPDRRTRADPRAGQPRRRRRDPAPPRLPALGPVAVSQPDRPGHPDLLRQPAWGCRPGRRRRPGRTLRGRPVQEGRRTVQWQPAEGRPGPGLHEPARGHRHGRAIDGPGPAGPAVLPGAHARGRRHRHDHLPVQPHPVGGAAGRRPGRDHPQRPPGRRRGGARPALQGDPPGGAGVRRAGAGRGVRGGRRRPRRRGPGSDRAGVLRRAHGGTAGGGHRAPPPGRHQQRGGRPRGDLPDLLPRRPGPRPGPRPSPRPGPRPGPDPAPDPPPGSAGDATGAGGPREGVDA